MNVSLTPKLEEFIRRKVAGGLFNNASEVVRDALRLSIERDSALPAAQDNPLSKDVVRGRLTLLEGALRERGLMSVALFGSVLHGGAGSGSDIDLLVDLDPGRRLSLVDLVGIGDFLEENLGRTVDLVTRDGIDPAIRDTVFSEAERVF
jgi:uncharacterized protein